TGCFLVTGRTSVSSLIQAPPRELPNTSSGSLALDMFAIRATTQTCAHTTSHQHPPWTELAGAARMSWSARMPLYASIRYILPYDFELGVGLLRSATNANISCRGAGLASNARPRW